jgi:hypothetical protein
VKEKGDRPMKNLKRETSKVTNKESDLIDCIISDIVKEYHDTFSPELENEYYGSSCSEYEDRSDEQVSFEGEDETGEWLSLEHEAEKEELAELDDCSDGGESLEDLMPVDVFMRKTWGN